MTTLSAVKHYMEDRTRATVADLAIGLETTPDNARNLLEMWRSKNRVRLIPGACGSCGKGLLGGCACPAATLLPDIYEWMGPQHADSPAPVDSGPSAAPAVGPDASASDRTGQPS